MDWKYRKDGVSRFWWWNRFTSWLYHNTIWRGKKCRDEDSGLCPLCPYCQKQFDNWLSEKRGKR